MQKQEFEERIGETVTDEQYKVIEEVYMWHPSVKNTSGKDEVAELYRSFGMEIFYDMLPRAKKAKRIDGLIRTAQGTMKTLQEEVREELEELSGLSAGCCVKEENHKSGADASVTWSSDDMEVLVEFREKLETEVMASQMEIEKKENFLKKLDKIMEERGNC